MLVGMSEALLYLSLTASNAPPPLSATTLRFPPLSLSRIRNISNRPSSRLAHHLAARVQIRSDRNKARPLLTLPLLTIPTRRPRILALLLAPLAPVDLPSTPPVPPASSTSTLSSLGVPPSRLRSPQGAVPSRPTSPGRSRPRPPPPPPPPINLFVVSQPASLEEWRIRRDELGPAFPDEEWRRRIHEAWEQTRIVGKEPVWCTRWTRLLSELATPEEWIKLQRLHRRDCAVWEDGTGEFTAGEVEMAFVRQGKRCSRG